jgi:hypothetical protein
MNIFIELEAPDNLSVLSDEDMNELCSLCARAENQVRSFSMTVWSEKIRRDHERHAYERGQYPIKNSRSAPRSILRKLREEEEEDDYISMEDFLDE